MSLESYKRSLEHQEELKRRLQYHEDKKTRNHQTTPPLNPNSQPPQIIYLPQRPKSNSIGTAGFVLAIINFVFILLFKASPIWVLLFSGFIPILIVTSILAFIF